MYNIYYPYSRINEPISPNSVNDLYDCILMVYSLRHSGSLNNLGESVFFVATSKNG